MIRTHRHHRRGISTLWLILTLPVFLTLLVFVVDISNLWLARVELENGLEAAALAAAETWGRSGSGSTEVPRDVGVKYAAANMIRGKSLTIDPNYRAGAPNENAACCHTAGPNPTGNLVFGSARTVDGKLTFNAGEVPACGVGTVLFDVTGNNLADVSAWGVSFVATAQTPANLTIASITFDLPVGRFIGDAQVSDRTPGGATPSIMVCQADTVGLNAGQIHFTRDNQDALGYRTLRIAFDPEAFAPGDHFRFGVPTNGVGETGKWLDDGDGVGAASVGVTVVFSVGGVLQRPVSVVFTNTDNRGWVECTNTGEFKDLPAPPTSGTNNDGQSYVLLTGVGQNDFAVRAQATVPVSSLAGKLLGDCIGPYYVTAKTTARYNCSENRAWLIRVERFLCPGPNP